MRNPCLKCNIHQSIVEFQDTSGDYFTGDKRITVSNEHKIELVRIKFCDNCDQRYNYVQSTYDPYMQGDPDWHLEEIAPSDATEELCEWLAEIGLPPLREIKQMSLKKFVGLFADAIGMQIQI